MVLRGKAMAKAGSMLAAIGLLSATGAAQQTPVPQQTVPPPVVAVPQAVALPAISAAQASQLQMLLSESRFAHGLVHNADTAGKQLSNDELVRAVLDYAKAVHSGRLDAGDFDANWGMRPEAYDPLPAFAEAVQRDRLDRWIARLSPQYSGYDGLRKGLDTYRRIEAAGGWKALPAGPDLTVGAAGPSIAALRTRLAVEDSQVAAGDKFDDALAEAVKRAQRRYGLNPTGVVAAQTRAALNVPVGDRVRQIMANMERWRWLPADLPKSRIQVNIASPVVTMFDGDTPIASMKAVTGAPGGRETPMLRSRIHSIVLNPPWNVPAGIAAKELFPKGPAYLARNGFKVIGTGANRRLQQQPGQSALGQYKFDFNNPYAVYLHDTPSRAKFASFDRLASHGCVRLEKPAPLARLLLKDDPKWTPEAIDAAIAKGETVRVSLPAEKQVEVFLFYWTAFASSNGTMSFRSDPYGWDKSLAAKIEKRSAAKAAAMGR